MTDRIVADFIDSNVFVVTKGDECIIFDAGADLTDVSKKVGNKKVVGVFLTHGHYDHAFYALEYANAFGCKIFCSEFAKEYLENSEYNYSDGKFFVSSFEKFEFLSAEGVVNVGNFAVEYK